MVGGDGVHKTRERDEKLREADKAARFWLVRQGLWARTNAAKHNDELTQNIEWERRDAGAAIAILGSLLEQQPPG